MNKHDDPTMRRLFEAAASDAEPPEGPPPFFVASVRATIAARGRETRHPVGAAALQMLPALAALVLIVAAWTGYESAQYTRERDEAMARIMAQSDGGDLLIAAVLLGQSGSDAAGGAK